MRIADCGLNNGKSNNGNGDSNNPWHGWLVQPW